MEEEEKESPTQGEGTLPGVIRQQALVVGLQKVLHLAQDIEPPVVQNLGQIRHTSHAHFLSWEVILIKIFF